VQDTLAAGASKTYDLYGGTDLPDLFGDPAPLRTLRAVAVVIESGGDAAGVKVGNAATPCGLFFGTATDTQLIFPNGPSFLQGSPAGVAVTAGANNLKVQNLGAVPVTVTVHAAGVKA
jgi:hypothetical protein